jgi:excisionase family DNA binding protein
MEMDLKSTHNLKQREVAQILNCSQGTVKNLRDRGLLAFFRPPGSNMVRISAKEVMRFIRQNTIKRRRKKPLEEK